MCKYIIMICLGTEVYIVPTANGKYQIQCSIMCSEYIEPEIIIIKIEVV